jgi:enediyne biosynthesis protein E4
VISGRLLLIAGIMAHVCHNSAEASVGMSADTAGTSARATSVFENMATQAGLTDVFPNGGMVSKQYIIETTGSGVGLIDYDNDGLPDIFVLSGEGGTNRMYHNEGRDKFRDVTDALGLHSSGWAQGVCAGDYDNDGYTDLFVTYWGQNHLYRNDQGRRFVDVTAAAHLTQDGTRYNTGCAFIDVDLDGHLDLFVSNYLKFDPASTPKPGANPYCYYRGIPVNCGPRGLPFGRNILYRNNGNGTFKDISDASGIAEPEGHYSLGVLTGDFNEDGLPDIYVACDQTPSLLYINRGHGKFEEEGVLRGVAFDQNGKAMSGMGVTADDYTGDGHTSIFRTNFSDEFETLYRNRGEGNFDDVTLDAGLGRNTRYVGWGAGFFDFNNDGWKDLLLVNGHAFPEVDMLHIDIHFKDRAILYQNLGGGTFRDISAEAGPALQEKHSSRGAAFGDIDNDGVMEVIINNQGEAPSLLKQKQSPPGHWVILQLVGTRSNRSAIGAHVKLRADGHTQTGEVRSGGSYLSQSDLRLHFGIGPATSIDQLEIAWPSGARQVLKNQQCERVLTITEPAH